MRWCALVACLVCAVSAGAYNFESNGIYYNITSRDPATVEVTYYNDYHKYTGSVNIPSSVTHDGTTYTVTAIGQEAFYRCYDLTNVTLPSTLIDIWNYAFYDCLKLEKVTLPNSLTYIGAYAFAHCGSDASSFTSVVIPDAVIHLGLGAFTGCTKLTNVTLGSGVIIMNENVFKECTALTNVTCLAMTPPVINSNAFDQSHYSDVVIIVPKSCKPVYQAADYWMNFTHYGQKIYDFEKDGVYYNITSTSTVEVTSETDYYGDYSDSYEDAVVIPSFVPYGGRTYTVNAIGNYAFKMCKGMSQITLPTTIETIGSYAFHYCEDLSEVVIPFSVTNIKNNAFWLCVNLREVVIPNSVTTVGSMTFRNCSILEKVVIGKSVTSIGSTCFYYCPEITEVTCLAEVPPTLYDEGDNTTFMPAVYESAALRVPYGSHEDYCNDSMWGLFANIVSKQDVEPAIVGDVDNDGSVTIGDVTAMIDLLLSEETPNNLAAVDMNGDNDFAINDLTTLIDQLLDDTAGSITTGSSARREFLINCCHFNIIKVDGGTFMMGLEGDDLATPVHQVTLSDYHIGETEVTQALWTAVMHSNPSYNQSSDDRPVENMDWYACQEFVNKLSAMTGENFSLPTEAQWEFAARGGNKSLGYIYSGSNNLDEVAWYNSNSGNSTHPVAMKKANELGLYDMSGNVFEWCQDYLGNYTSEAQIDPQGPATGDTRVCRGSAYLRYNNNNWFKCGGRTGDTPTMAAQDSGLRLAIEPDAD